MLQVFSEVRVGIAHLLLLLVCIILVTLCSLLYFSVFHVWSLSLDYILLISTRILVPLITISYATLLILYYLIFDT